MSGPAFPRPPADVDLEPWLAETGRVFLEIRDHDSGCTSYGVAIDGRRWFVKAAPAEQRWQLAGAVAVHRRVRHPAIVPLVAGFETGGGGQAVVYPFVDGANLNDPQVPGALPREHPDSVLNGFRALDDARSLAAYDVLLEAHVAVAAAGLVAVDLYDGCLLWDGERDALHLVDLDLYAPPYTLDRDRQYGSTRLMAPEEFRRGAWVGEPATVYTLARLALLLGCARTAPLLDVVIGATQPLPEDRPPTVAAYAERWRATAPGSGH